MIEHELEQWTATVIAEARHGRSPKAARREREQLEREHPELRAEASLWAEFATLEQPRPGERSDDDLIARVLARANSASATLLDDPELDHSDEPTQPRRASEPISLAAARKPRRTQVLIGLVALAACIALGFAIDLPQRLAALATTGTRSAEQPRGGAAMAREGAEPEILVALPGERHALAGDDCRRVGRGATLCTREGVRFTVERSSTDGHVKLRLESGQLHIESLDDATLVEIETPAGIVRSHGEVELDFDPEAQEIDVEVIAGEAEVSGRMNGEAPLHLGVGAALTLLAGPEHRLEPERVLEPTQPPAPLPAPARRPPTSEHEGTSADELLAAAQRALAEGETSTAIDRYRELIRRHGESRAARTATVSLGRLLLGQGQAREALEQFDAYVTSGASELIEEARYGRIRALRQLDRTDDLADSIDEFLRAHPTSIHRTRLEHWQGELAGAGEAP